MALIIVALSIMLAGCGETVTTLSATTEGAQPVPSTTVVTTAPPTTTGTSATTTTTIWSPSSGEGAVMIYLIQGESLAVTWRPTGPHEAAAIMEGLLSGPTPLEEEMGFSTVVPIDTTLRSVTVSGDTAVVDLSPDIGSGGGSLSMLLRVAQVVYSLTELPGVTRVEFMIDGSPVEALGGEGVIVEGGVTRSDFVGLLPPVLLIAPAPFETIQGTVTVRGNAAQDVEALDILVTGRDGLILTETTLELRASVDNRRPFETEIAFSGTAARGAIILTWIDPDGRKQVLEMPVEVELTEV